MTDAGATDSVAISPAARTFVVTTTGASLAAFNLGFDLGAFDNVDHRKIWAVWVICTVALISSYLFRDNDYRLGGHWRFVLLVPSLLLIADALIANHSETVVIILLVLSILALPFAGYILIRLVAGNYVSLTPTLRTALIATAVVVFAVGWFVGDGHRRFLNCQDFARAGEYIPDNCQP